MTKQLEFFKSDLPDSHDQFSYTRNGQLYLLFDTNKSEIKAGHEKVIREKVVDFLVRAVRALGPDDDYKLKVLGMTSATGSADYNQDLAAARAYNSAMSAIKMFEALQPSDPTLAGTTINPVVEVLADKYARVDAAMMHLKSRHKIEKSQDFFRSAVFAFKGANDVEPFESPNIVARGPEASRRAMELLAKSQPASMLFHSPWGDLMIRKGQVWKPHARLIVAIGSDRIVYLEGETLWAVPTPDFAREVMLDGLIAGVVAAKPMMEVSMVVMTFIQGIFVGPSVAIAAKLIVLFMWAGAHQTIVNNAIDAARPVFQGLKLISQRYPTLWKKILDRIGEQVGQDLKQALIDTVTGPENIAFFLGRIIRGLFFGKDISGLSAAQQEAALKAVQLSIGRVAFVVVEVAVLVTALHLPAALLAITTESVKTLAEQLRSSFAKPDIGIPLAQTEADAIARELLGFSDTKQVMQGLEKPLKDFQKLLVQFSKDFKP